MENVLLRLSLYVIYFVTIKKLSIMNKLFQNTDELRNVVVNNEVELSDISKDATVWLSFTPNEKDDFGNYYTYCFLHNIIRDGALYFIGENLEKIDDSDLDCYYDDLNDYDCWTENIEEEYVDVESMAEQLVNDFVEARWDEYEYDKGAMANENGYTITICVGGKKVFEWNSVEAEDAANAPIKQVRLAIFAAQQPKFISLQTLCDGDMEVVDENGASVDTYDYLVDHGSGEWVNLAFVPVGCSVELNVTNPDADDDDEYTLYSDEEFEISPSWGMMNMQEATDNYEDDSAGLEEYSTHLNVKLGDDHDRLTNKGLKVAWEGLKTNEVSCENFVPAVMQYVMTEEGRDKAFLRGLQVEDITMVFNIDIPDGEEFDPSKLDFISIDTEYEDNSEVLSELLAEDMVLLNAIIYDGKIYFADGYDDVTEDGWGEADYYYDIVDKKESVETSSSDEILTLKQYILGLDYLFEEFDMEANDGSCYTRFGKLGEFDLFDEKQIDDVLSDNYIYDAELSTDSLFDEVSEDDLYCVVSNLAENLDQGSIKLLEIKDGSNIIFEVSND